MTEHVHTLEELQDVIADLVDSTPAHPSAIYLAEECVGDGFLISIKPEVLTDQSVVYNLHIKPKRHT